jgi:hypothetical protein
MSAITSLVFLCWIASLADAAVVCVDNDEALRDALLTAAINGEDDEIRIEQGLYAGPFLYDSAEPGALSLRGGYSNGCENRLLDATNTILTGNSSNQVLTVWALPDPEGSASFLLEGLTLRDGIGTDVFGAGLAVSVRGATYLSRNTIEQNLGGGATIFLQAADTLEITGNVISANTSDLVGGGLGVFCSDSWIETDAAATITLSNNIISGNRAAIGGGVHLQSYCDASVALANNSIVDNSADYGSGLGLFLSGGAGSSAALYNNLFWANGPSLAGNDIFILRGSSTDGLIAPVTLLHNNFDQSQPGGLWSSPPILIDPSNLDAVDPLFVDADNGDLHLQSDSPMIDAGYPDTPDLPEFDFDGKPRVNGEFIDIGAYEYEHQRFITTGDCLLNWAETQYPALFPPSETTRYLSPFLYRYYSNTGFYLRVSDIDNAVSYLSPQGHIHDVGNIENWLPIANCMPKPTNCLFDWAESNYPGLFAPAGASSVISYVDTYRYYPQTQSYLGLSSQDDRIWYQSGDDRVDAGPYDDWMATAGCSL